MNALDSAADMAIGFVSGRPVYDDGRDLWTDAGLGRLVDALRTRSRTLHVAASLAPKRRELDDHRLELPRASLVALPWFPTTARSLHLHRAAAAGIRRVESLADVVIVQLPFPTPSALLSPRRPRVYHVCADVRAVVAAGHPSGLAALVRRAFANVVWRYERTLAAEHDCRVVAHGAELLGQFGAAAGVSVVSSTILASEVGGVSRTRSADAPFRVLYVGYLREAKGIHVLLSAFERLLADHPAAELCIVGARGVADGDAAERIVASITRLQAKGAVQFLGNVPFGPRLFQCYADSDVLVLPTLSEGTPRVLVEARAFGCPVVASRVGGIPSSVTDGVDGLLVSPGDAGELASVLRRLAGDGALRARLTAAGRDRADQLTVEAFADSILAEASRLVPSRARSPLSGSDSTSTLKYENG